ncbi:MAG: PepSY-associated TM helix domain-containing protein [Planctomycetota bacterium]
MVEEKTKSAGRSFRPSKLARQLHIYVSLLGFGTLIFFSLTGLTLNHASFFEAAEPVETELAGVLELDAGRHDEPAFETNVADGSATKSDTRSGDSALIPVIEAAREACSISARLTDWSGDDEFVYLSFRGPGYAAELEIDRSSGAYSGYALRQGTWAVLNDLHKGRGTGKAWAWAIDISAIVLLMSGVTGLWLLGFLRRIRRAGFLVTAVGSVLLLVVAVKSLG